MKTTDANESAKPTHNLLTRREALLYIAGGDPNLFSELKTIFVRSMPQYIRTLAEAFERADSEAIRTALHKIKGTIQLVGADQTLKLIEGMADTLKVSDAMPSKEAARVLLTQLETIAVEVSNYPQKA